MINQIIKFSARQTLWMDPFLIRILSKFSKKNLANYMMEKILFLICSKLIKTFKAHNSTKKIMKVVFIEMK